MPLEDLTRPEAHGVELWQLPGWPEEREIAFYRVSGYKMWGLTYRVVGSIREYLASHEL